MPIASCLKSKLFDEDKTKVDLELRYYGNHSKVKSIRIFMAHENVDVAGESHFSKGLGDLLRSLAYNQKNLFYFILRVRFL